MLTTPASSVAVSTPKCPAAEAAGLTHWACCGIPEFKPAFQATLYKQACGPPDEDSQLDPRIDYEAVKPAPADD